MVEDLRALARRFGLVVAEDAPLVSCAPPGSAEAAGLVAAFSASDGSGPGGIAPDLLLALQSSPISFRHDTAARLLGAHCGTWHRDPHVWLFEGVDGVLAAVGAVSPLGTAGHHSGVVAMDARGDRPAGVALVIHGHPWIVRAERGQLEVAPAGREKSALGLALGPRQPLPEVSPPDVGALVGAHPVQGWLVERARSLADSPSLLDRASAVGLLGRLADAEVTAPQAALALRLGGDPGPAARVRAWAASLDDEVVAELERALSVELGALGDELESFGEDSTAENTAAERVSSALGLRLRRDDLESVAYVLRERVSAESREVLEGALLGVDRLGLLRQDELDCVEDVAPPRQLRAIGWREQRAWWGVRP